MITRNTMIQNIAAPPAATTTPDRDGVLLHVRSLNELRHEHAPTYLGARILAESCPPGELGDRTADLLRRKAETGQPQVYKEYVGFKGLDRNGVPAYRTFHVGNPMTHLAETWALARLSREPAFAPHPAVYSHRWPQPKAGHIFAPYFDDYRRREFDIAFMAKARRSRVLVLDLKDFSPSADAGSALPASPPASTPRRSPRTSATRWSCSPRS